MVVISGCFEGRLISIPVVYQLYKKYGFFASDRMGNKFCICLKKMIGLLFISSPILISKNVLSFA